MSDWCSWVGQILQPSIEDLPTICTNIISEKKEEPAPPIKYDPTILVHGTAETSISKEKVNATLVRIKEAVIEAYKELAKGCEAVDALELAIRALEKHEINSKISEGSNKNCASLVRSAALMDSRMNAGIAGGVIDTERYAIVLAKNLLREGKTILVVESSNSGSAGDTISETGSPTTPKQLQLYGAVVRDRKGRLAAGILTVDDGGESIEKLLLNPMGMVLGCGAFSSAHFCTTVSSKDRAAYILAPARMIVDRLVREERKNNTEKSNDQVEIKNLLEEELASLVESTEDIGAAALGIEGQPEVVFTNCYFPWARCIDGSVISGYVEGEVSVNDIGDIGMPLDCNCD